MIKYSILLSISILAVSTFFPLYGQTKRSEFIHLENEESGPAQSIVNDLNAKAHNVVLRSGKFDIRDIHYFNERDTLIAGTLYKVVDVEYLAESHKRFARKYLAIRERYLTSMIMKLNRNNEWKVSNFYNRELSTDEPLVSLKK